MFHESNIFNLIKESDFNTKIATSVTKGELKAEQDKIMNLQTHDLSYYLVDVFDDDDGFQNMFVYQPTLDTLELKKGQGSDYILSRKSKGMYTSKLKPM